MTLLRDYIDGWRRHDIPAVLETLAADSVVTECYGPVHRGRDCVERWMKAWFAAGGTVTDWTITQEDTSPGVLVAEWTFSCIWQEEPATFEGATIARVTNDKITYLREYTTTADRYDWQGTWRE